jgi:hypothetical protein
MIKDEHLFSLATSQARFAAWWRGGLLDRPPVNFWLESQRPVGGPVPRHASLRERWLDVGFQVESAFANLSARPWMGDSVPSWMPNVGPDLTSTPFGAQLEFGEHTSWCQHTIAETSGWEAFLGTEPDFSNPYWKAIDAMIERAAERFGDRFYVAMPDLHGSFDILAGLRGPEDLCLDIVDAPDLVFQASLHAARAYAEAFRRFHKRLTELGQPGTTWTPYLHPGPAYVPSCDFWCLVSREIGERMIRPSIEIEMAQMERSIFHLDGPQALQHLDTVLALPGLNALQWVFGAGHGPASRWIDVFRRSLDAGKPIQVLAETVEDALTVLKAVGPKGVWITLCCGLPDPKAGAAFLDQVKSLSS